MFFSGNSIGGLGGTHPRWCLQWLIYIEDVFVGGILFVRYLKFGRCTNRNTRNVCFLGRFLFVNTQMKDRLCGFD